MNYWGISAIHWNVNLDDIDEVRLHKIIRQWRDGTYKISHAEPAWCSDVIGLIRGGHKVWVVVPDGRGKFTNTERVHVNVKQGGHAFLHSCTKDGTPTSALTDLPRYLRPDDLPAKPRSDSAAAP